MSGRIFRTIAGAAIAVALGVVTYTGEATSCSDVVLGGSPAEIGEICRPLALTDLPAVAALLLIFLLLAWDYTEVSLANIFSLKGRIDHQEQRQAASEREVANLRLDVTQATASIAARVSQDLTQQFDFNFFPADADKTRDELPAKIDKFSATIAPIDSPVAAPGTVAKPEPKELELIRLAERLRLLTRPSRLLPLTPVESDLAGAFATELQLVHGVRNRIAHAMPVDSKDLETALVVARAMVDLVDKLDSGPKPL